MSRKCLAVDSYTAGKKKTRSNNLEVRLDVLRCLNAREWVANIAKVLSLPPISERTIHINANKIKECAQSMTSLSATRII